MKNEHQKHYFGNCLTVALSFKLHNITNTKIIYIPSNQIEAGGFPHFMWYNKIDNNVYDFSPIKHQNNLFEVLWCEGIIECRSYDAFTHWKELELKKVRKEEYDILG